MAIVIKRLTLDRLDEALSVYRAALGEHHRITKEAIAERLQNGTGLFYGAFDTETDALVGIKFGFIDGSTCVGRGIAVLPTYRRRGIGTSLVQQFESDLATRPGIRNSVFGSSSAEGVPFHLAQGYHPRLLIQFENPALREKLDLSDLQITHEDYNRQYHVYQIYAELGDADQNLAYVQRLAQERPEVNVGFQFSKFL